MGTRARRPYLERQHKEIAMTIALYTFATLACLATLGLILLGRSGSRITTGRYGRLARLGRLSARLWSSWAGAKVRRLFASKERRARYDEERRKRDAAAVTETMGQMKGAVMKLGQMLSFVSDSIPAEYQTALESLQASAPPMDFALIRDVAEGEFGKPLERMFARFDEKPLAAASIGQVHRAQLPSGEEVVVKIQYPGVAEAIQADLANVAFLHRIAALFYPAMEPKPIIAELRGRVLEELDYINEAKNQRAFYDLYEGHPFIRIPKVFESHSTARVLTSEYVEGRRYDDIRNSDDETRARFAEALYRFVFGSIIRYGVFNGDPHPGNYLYDDQGRVVFLDYGCVKYFPEPMLRNWLALIEAHIDENPEAFREQIVELGFLEHGSPVTAETIYDYFGYIYRPFKFDEEFEYTSEYSEQTSALMLKPEGPFEKLPKQLNLPADFLFVNRIQWGVVSILTQLNASENWYRIHREFGAGAPASTELGEQNDAYRLEWRNRRDIYAPELLLRSNGIVERSIEVEDSTRLASNATGWSLQEVGGGVCGSDSQRVRWRR
jgi:predicted unusual protein kinase regulating ubiquinone biosynthesis (AarF/ABC1/UbiB family)